ncbi:hypothetical protein K9L27_02360 [Candidatus Gracilibacteria bacterium]|nr:hypothetical protein [Candidatus Gracilibacteria bacterium]
MNIKKTLSVFGILFFCSFWVIEVEAVNTAARFRGSGTRYLEKIQLFTQQVNEVKKPRYSTPRLRSSLSGSSNEAQKTLTGTVRKFSSRDIPFSRTTTSAVQGLKENSSAVQTFSARLIPFTITLPSDFQQVFDTLDWDQGSINFKDAKNTRIEVTASSDRCDGGTTFVRTCLSRESNQFIEQLRSQIPGMELKKNEDVSLDLSKIQLDKTNRGLYVEMLSSNYNVGHLTFFDPVKEYVWQLKIIDPESSRGILKDSRVIQHIFSSLLSMGEKDAAASKPTARALVTTDRRSEQGTSVLGKSPERFDASQTQKFEAKNISFGIEVPNYFEQISDSLDWNTGEMVFEGNSSRMVIAPTENVCDDQTPRLKRRCIEEYAAQFAKDLQQQFEKGQILQDENMLLQLEDIANSSKDLFRTQSSKNQIGRLFMMRSDGRREGILTFSEPIHGFVWKIFIEAPEGVNYFWNDVRQKSKTFSSLFFRGQ